MLNPDRSSRWLTRRSNRAALLFLAGVFCAVTNLSASAELGFTGSDTCIGCHAEQGALWQQSHHARSQAPVSTVQPGDAELAGVDVTFHGQRTRFERRSTGGDGQWTAHITEAGETRSLPLRYRFGFDPLQQFVVEAEHGRLQVLNVAWDSRPAGDGGQRWFHLQADATPKLGGFAHWHSPQMNWNRNCASCHTTGFERGYDAQSDRYQTTFEEGFVGCESCHGPGKAHAVSHQTAVGGSASVAMPVRWPGTPRWRFADGAKLAGPDRQPHQSGVDQCSRCHSLRSELADHEPGQSFLDGYAPLPMTREIFHADGQVRGESFVWAAFVQSKMYAAGVDCANCHDPHSGGLVAEGDALCGQCHTREVYATPVHHGHPSPAVACVDCHMREVTVMQIDGRRDHSFRVPRPDLADLGGPSACSDCHSATGDDEAHFASAIQTWRDNRSRAGHRSGEASQQRDTQARVAAALASYWREAPSAGRDLQRLAADPSANVLARFTAASALDLTPEQVRWNLRQPQPVARLIEAYRSASAPGPHNVDRSDGQRSLAAVQRQSGNVQAALDTLDRALAIDSNNTAALLSLAALLETTRGPEAAIARLHREAQTHPDLDQGAIAYTLGLMSVRAGDTDAARASLDRAVQLDPSHAGYQLASVLARTGSGAGRADLQSGLETINAAREQHPDHGELLRTQIDLQIRLGRFDDARLGLQRYEALGGDLRWVRAMNARIKTGVGGEK